jgi:hypothetical protein
LDYGIPIEVSDDSKERISRRRRTHPGSVCKLPARCGNKGYIDNYDRNGRLTTWGAEASP